MAKTRHCNFSNRLNLYKILQMCVPSRFCGGVACLFVSMFFVFGVTTSANAAPSVIPTTGCFDFKDYLDVKEETKDIDCSSSGFVDTFSYGDMYGIGICSGTSGTTAGQMGTPGAPNSNGSNYCWCKLTGFDDGDVKVTGSSTYAVYSGYAYNKCTSEICACTCAELMADPESAVHENLCANNKFCAYYTLTYNCGGGSGTPPTDSGGPYTYADVATTASTEEGCNVPSGKTFAGWSCTNAGIVEPGEEIKIVGDTVCTAQYGYNVRYNCNNGGGNPPDPKIVIDGASFTPAANTCTPPSGKVFSGWLVDETRDVLPANVPVTYNYASDINLVAQYATFAIQTTSLSAGNTFKFYVSANMGTFYVNCGTDGTLSGTDVSGNRIVKSNTNNLTYTCTYSTGGVKVIEFISATATAYAGTTTPAISIHTDSKAKVAALLGSLSSVFPYIGSSSGQAPSFYASFLGCTNLTSLSGTLFSGYTTGGAMMFFQTFKGCTGLTSLPSGFFSNIVTPSASMFADTFRDCTRLTYIPGDLFSGITTGVGNLFGGTFANSGLVSIPNNLFSNIASTANSMFASTFYNCTGLSGKYIPFSLFSDLIRSGSPYTDDMMLSIFEGSNLVTTCPSGTKQYVTGYESYWSGKVSCGTPITCASGKYLQAGSINCNTSCPSGYTCSGGSYGFHYSENQGLTQSAITVALTWDNGGTPTSCTYGGAAFTPPTPTARTGFTFTGWALRSLLDFRNLTASTNGAHAFAKIDDTHCWDDINRNGSCNTDVAFSDLPRNGWKISFSSKDVLYGTAGCSTTTGSFGQIGTPTIGSGEYCWCKATGYLQSSHTVSDAPKYALPWVATGYVSSCSSQCVISCASSGMTSSGFRTSLYNQH